jgi:hypothetical protein
VLAWRLLHEPRLFHAPVWLRPFYPDSQAAVVELLIGNGTWNRHSPIDPFCGMEDARY